MRLGFASNFALSYDAGSVDVMKRRWKDMAWLVWACGWLWGCFYPPMEQPPPFKQTRIELAVPYDIAFEAVIAVAKQDKLALHARDPSSGVIEAQARGFRAREADCGQVRSGIGKVAAMPTDDASAVFNFYIMPKGREASTVTVQAVFSTPVEVPLHPPQSVTCVSLGVAEGYLLHEVEQMAATLYRPQFKAPTGPGDGGVGARL
jgi:hypothetical protein